MDRYYVELDTHGSVIKYHLIDRITSTTLMTNDSGTPREDLQIFRRCSDLNSEFHAYHVELTIFLSE